MRVRWKTMNAMRRDMAAYRPVVIRFQRVDSWFSVSVVRLFMDDSATAWSIVLVRLALGLVIFIHGVGKLLQIGPTATPPAEFTGFLASLGIPLPGLFTWIVALVETIGGLFILVGLLTRFAAAAVGIDMLVATLLVHVPEGFSVSNGGFEYTFVLFLLAVALVISGAGPKLSLDRALGL
jgi:putative oxidoreductase